MPEKRNAKSSKTDHVLNLISGMTPSHADSPAKKPPEPVKQEPDAVPPPSSPYSSDRRGAPILEVARTNHEALSETIHQALEESLEKELKSEKEREDSGTPVQGTASVPKSVQKAAASSESVKTTRSSVPAPSEPQPPVNTAASIKGQGSRILTAPSDGDQPDSALPSIQHLPDGSALVNVMQILVDENIDRYMDMFHVCRCPRCVADVKALALTQLSAKYVVLEKDTQSSMLNFYRHRYAASVTVELTKACSAVGQSPHHSEIPDSF